MRKGAKYMTVLLGAISVFLFGRSESTFAAGNATMLPDASILVDYEFEEMEITAGRNKVIYYSDVANAELWEAVEAGADGKAVFDISWVKPNQTTRVYVKGDADNLVTARYVEAQEKLSAEFVGDISAADVVDIDAWKQAYRNYPSFNNETGYILFFTRQGGADTAYFNLENIEWRKGTYGNWQSFDRLNLAQMSAKGASLFFRIKAVNDAVNAANTQEIIKGHRYSTEAKVFLQKVAAAPTISVNNLTMSLTLRNGMEYSLNDKDWTLIPTYSKNATSNEVAVKVVDFDILPTTNRRVTTVAVPLILDVATNRKIDASIVTENPGKYEVEKNEAGELTGIYVFVRVAAGQRKAASKTTKVLIPFATENPDIANDITVEYQKTKKGNSGIVITNNTNAKDGTNYQYAIVDDPDRLTPEELSELKWSTLKAAKSVRVSSTKALTGKYLIFRVLAGSKSELPSAYQKYPYRILYDKVAYAAISTTSYYPGGVITAVTSNNAIAGDITYTWERSATSNGTYTAITSGTGYANSMYTIKESDIGYYIRVVISNTSQTGEKASATSSSSGKIVKDPTAPTPTP